MTDFRALCARMADELDHYRQLLMDDRREAHALAAEARAALAQPEPVPVPVSERLPVSADCDEQGWVWAWRVYDAQDDDSGDYWMQIPYGWLPHYSRWSHWLPANALPTPE